ncbi:hypothetical protein [Desulfofustis limnaeus]|uniref:Uncharacterized protein n=1 Tax=Desulfofustis limnaeus TaxID=2740163 RepID=A0ABM7W4V0_9BACT|nr:hypothetical protein [Desulfofustis limnaeus]BDD85943.1 hypothetical protein DPPLL_03080 [Desulfofustis limnaeus]
MKSWIKEIQDNGRILLLGDGTKYKVSSYDAYDTKFWMKMDNVSVIGSKLTNHIQRDKTIEVTKTS